MIRDCIRIFMLLLSFLVFVGLSKHSLTRPAYAVGEIQDRVVISAPVLLVLYGGDRFLASNLEFMRLSATGLDSVVAESNYIVRAQGVVADLNPCHEDNYYLANGLLTWGGAVHEGNKVLSSALECRSWDFIPAFFYGVNLAFFERDIPKARRVLEIGARRSPENAAVLLKFAIMLKADSFADEKLALDYLISQRDSTFDLKLKEMLNKRVIRLEGLVALRDAKRRFEVGNSPLKSIDQLVDGGFLQYIPNDPLGLGYELLDGRIVLKRVRIAGLESQ